MMAFIVGKNSQDSKNHTEKPVGETENKIINPSYIMILNKLRGILMSRL